MWINSKDLYKWERNLLCGNLRNGNGNHRGHGTIELTHSSSTGAFLGAK